MAALQAEKDELELKLAVAKSDRAAAVANLQGEVASLQSRLSRANKAAKEAQEQARAAEARLAEAASAAEAAAGVSRDEEVGLRQRLQAAEALTQQQAQQLEVLHGKVALTQQQAQQLEVLHGKVAQAQQVGAASLLGWAGQVGGSALDLRDVKLSSPFVSLCAQQSSPVACHHPLTATGPPRAAGAGAAGARRGGGAAATGARCGAGSRCPPLLSGPDKAAGNTAVDAERRLCCISLCSGCSASAVLYCLLGGVAKASHPAPLCCSAASSRRSVRRRSCLSTTA